jgi:hypothetical protein
MSQIQKYSITQVSIALLYSALSLEYYMNETYNIYEGERRIWPAWTESLEQLMRWSIDECWDLGLSAEELEAWGDDLLINGFIPIAGPFLEKVQASREKLAITVLVLSDVLKEYLNISEALGKDRVAVLFSELNKHLSQNWQVGLENSMVSPGLGDSPFLVAQEFAQAWRTQLESLVR